MNLHIRVTELSHGIWRAAFAGEEDAGACLDRSPDQALAGLVRFNLRRFGVADIHYDSDVVEADAGEYLAALGRTAAPDTGLDREAE